MKQGLLAPVSVDDAVDGVARQSHQFSYLRSAFAVLCHVANSFYLQIGQLCSWVVFAVQVMIAVLAAHVCVILDYRAYPEVSRITTSGIVATVTDKRSGWNVSLGEHVGQALSVMCFAKPSDLTVSLPVLIAHPGPAGSRAIGLIDFLPEVFGCILSGHLTPPLCDLPRSGLLSATPEHLFYIPSIRWKAEFSSGFVG